MYSLVIFLKDFFFIYLRLLSFLFSHADIFIPAFLPCITQVLKFFCDTRRSLIVPKMCLDKSAWEQLGCFRLACIFEKHFN